MVENIVVDSDSESKVKLSKIELGNSYSAKINVETSQKTSDPNVVAVLNYEFQAHVPTVEDDLNIAVKAKNLLKDLVVSPDLDINTLAVVYATLDSVVDKIFCTKDNGVKVEIKKKFWDWIKGKRNSSKLISEVVLPTFVEFKKFESELDISEDELKNL